MVKRRPEPLLETLGKKLWEPRSQETTLQAHCSENNGFGIFYKTASHLLQGLFCCAVWPVVISVKRVQMNVFLMVTITV